MPSGMAAIDDGISNGSLPPTPSFAVPPSKDLPPARPVATGRQSSDTLRAGRCRARQQTHLDGHVAVLYILRLAAIGRAAVRMP